MMKEKKEMITEVRGQKGKNEEQNVNRKGKVVLSGMRVNAGLDI